MNTAYLTAEEIYKIDRLTEADLPDYLLSLPKEKQELVSHIFSKNRAAKAWKVIADEKDEGIERLHELLERNGVKA